MIMLIDRAGMQETHLDEELDAAQQCQLYTHLDHPKHAVTLTCLDARKLQLISSSGGLRLFRHRQRPAVFVHLMGRIVGIEEKEKKVVWLVDDGSAVIAVHHHFRLSNSSPLIKDKLRPSRKGKERQVDKVIDGIPSEYLLPPPPPLPASSETQEKQKKANKAPINVAGVFEIGDLVSIVGRVELWIDRRERIVFVDSVVQCQKQTAYDRAEHEGSIQLITDPNGEPKHLIQALHLSATEYSKPYERPNLISKDTSEWGQVKLREISSSASSSKAVSSTTRDIPSKAQGLRVMEEPMRSIRVMEDVSDLTNNGAARKRSLGMTRRPLPEQSSKQDKLDKVQIDKGKEHRVRTENESIDLPSSLLSISSKSTSPTPRQRQLRHYTKLSDSKMTDSTFRVYVEKHIVDYCSGDLSMQVTTLLDATPKASNRRGAQHHTPTPGGPPAFTLNYLMQVNELRGHAKRTVEVLTKRREEKKRRKVGSSTTTANIVISTEKASDKMKRLYTSVIQAMLMDGIIVLALPTTKMKPPFNGKRQCQDDGKQSPGFGFDQEYEYRRAPIQEDAYQVVTHALLSGPIMDVFSRSRNPNGNLNSVQIVQKLQATDERWRYIRSESVQEGMRLLLPRDEM